MPEEGYAVVNQLQGYYWDLDLDSCIQKEQGIHYDLLCFGKVHYGNWPPI